jgi:hypothetical protein
LPETNQTSLSYHPSLALPSSSFPLTPSTSLPISGSPAFGTSRLSPLSAPRVISALPDQPSSFPAAPLASLRTDLPLPCLALPSPRILILPFLFAFLPTPHSQLGRLFPCFSPPVPTAELAHLGGWNRRAIAMERRGAPSPLDASGPHGAPWRRQCRKGMISLDSNGAAGRPHGGSRFVEPARIRSRLTVGWPPREPPSFSPQIWYA